VPHSSVPLTSADSFAKKMALETAAAEIDAHVDGTPAPGSATVAPPSDQSLTVSSQAEPGPSSSITVLPWSDTADAVAQKTRLLSAKVLVLIGEVRAELAKVHRRMMASRTLAELHAHADSLSALSNIAARLRDVPDFPPDLDLPKTAKRPSSVGNVTSSHVRQKLASLEKAVFAVLDRLDLFYALFIATPKAEVLDDPKHFARYLSFAKAIADTRKILTIE